MRKHDDLVAVLLDGLELQLCFVADAFHVHVSGQVVVLPARPTEADKKQVISDPDAAAGYLVVLPEQKRDVGAVMISADDIERQVLRLDLLPHLFHCRERRIAKHVVMKVAEIVKVACMEPSS